jgi:glycosyltransferase involved in cell wall biosynthesis
MRSRAPAPSGPWPFTRQPRRVDSGRQLRGKRAAMVVFSYYPMDPRPRRAAEALVQEGMKVELICLREPGRDAGRETVNGVDVLRVPLQRRRAAFWYVFQYAIFLLIALGILAARCLTRRYSLVHVHNMPDILVLCAVIPKVLGAKVILDLHDPMPELMMTIFKLDQESGRVRTLRRLERWSIQRADLALTVNLACKRLFVSRSCGPEKIAVVMNSPDEQIFGAGRAGSRRAARREESERFVIMYHGSLVERNGLDLAVQAIGRVEDVGGGVELRIYGAETPFLARVMESVRAQGLADVVRYLGPRRLEDIVEAIAECDVGIIPNQRSVFAELNTPTRIFEYLAMGKPVIAPRAAGILDYFDDDSLILFELGNAEDLARRIAWVRAEPGKAAETVRRGQEVHRAHAWSGEREVFLELVDELLSDGAAR